jgi:hypothetical protein
MSQRRQETRRAAQDRRRQERRNARVQRQRHAQSTSRTAGAAAVPAAAPARRFRTAVLLRYAAFAAGGLALVALVVWLVMQQFKPLPGTKFPTNGNAHVEPGQAHGAYYSNPPTSGWHYAAIPNPGIYTNPFPPEGLGHFMEHGGVWVTYTCPGGRDGCPEVAQELEEIVNKAIDRNKPVAVAPYPSDGRTPPEHRINVLAWQYMLSMDEVDRGQINEFIDRHACGYNPEGGGWCGPVKGKTAPEKDAGQEGYNAIGVAAGATAEATITPIASATPAPAGPTPAPTTAATPVATATP